MRTVLLAFVVLLFVHIAQQRRLLNKSVYMLPLKFDDGGRAYIKYDSRRFYNDRDEEVTVREGDCVWSLELEKPTKEERRDRAGFRTVTAYCDSQFTEM
ncbi:unnamed protein product [Calicophoron daubneyi]|uniref:Uncharacterized protein n=1 Tax=Calicophoron daubneyi TaxID=300641 RepID=A0AAV2T5K3_CALDB